MIDRGTSSTMLAALMGHESSAVNEPRYIHLLDSSEQTRSCGRRWRA